MPETIFVRNIFFLVLSLEFSCIELVHNLMNNLSSYYGLVDAKIRASDKDLPVLVVLVGGADRDGPPCEFKLVVVDIEPAPWSI